jgi:XapX domain-containing protein
MIAGLIGIMVGLGVGAGCRYFDIPSPAPPRVVGALLLIAMTLGVLSADLVLGGKPLLVWP